VAFIVEAHAIVAIGAQGARILVVAAAMIAATLETVRTGGLAAIVGTGMEFAVALNILASSRVVGVHPVVAAIPGLGDLATIAPVGLHLAAIPAATVRGPGLGAIAPAPLGLVLVILAAVTTAMAASLSERRRRNG
jgi:hypothetical protein